MTNDEKQLHAKITELEIIVSEIESKVADLWARPKMPYSQGASSGDVLELDSGLIPQWVTP
jgi:hypothetical protein